MRYEIPYRDLDWQDKAIVWGEGFFKLLFTIVAGFFLMVAALTILLVLIVIIGGMGASF